MKESGTLKMSRSDETFHFFKLEDDKGWSCTFKRGPSTVEFVAKSVSEIPTMLDDIRKVLPLPAEESDSSSICHCDDSEASSASSTSASMIKEEEEEEGEDIESTDNETESTDTELTEDKEFVSEHPDDVAVDEILEVLKKEEDEESADTAASDSCSDSDASSVYEPPPRRQKDAERKAFLESAPKISVGAKLLNVKVPRKRKPRGPKATKKKEDELVSVAAAAGVPTGVARKSPVSPLAPTQAVELSQASAFEAELDAHLAKPCIADPNLPVIATLAEGEVPLLADAPKSVEGFMDIKE